MIEATAETRRFSGGLWAAIAVILVALNLRPVIVAISPLLDELSADLALSASLAGLLMTLPVLCFGLLGPLAPVIAARWGFERSLAVALAAILVGSVFRGLPEVWSLFSGTILIGAGIAMGNILLPGLIKRDFQHRLGLMSGLFSLSLTAGATIGAGITIPLAQAAGWSWNESLASWAVFALVGLVCWIPHLRRAQSGGENSTGPRIRLIGDPVAWYVTVLFGLQSLNFYAMTAWMPSMMIGLGYDAVFGGYMLSLYNLLSIPLSVLVPMVLVRMRKQSVLTTLISVTFFVSMLGWLWAPELSIWWVAILGTVQGGALGMALMLIVSRAPDALHATKLSGMAQSWGYVIAAGGPLLVGMLYDVSGAWTWPLIFLTVSLVPQTISAYLAGRPRMVGGGTVESASRTRTVGGER